MSRPEAGPPPTPEAVPPAGMSGQPGWLLQVIRDQRVAFLFVGGINTVVGIVSFAGFLVTVGQRSHYLVVLVCAHVVSVLIAFVLYRFVVFRVRGHVLSDLWRFETVYLVALAVNFVLLPVLVEIAHLPVLLAQALVMLVTSVMSWVGHKNYSFRRRSSSAQGQR
jgi:putative flippase GtrA